MVLKKKAIASVCMGLLLAGTVAGQDVAEDELRRAEDSDVEFTNYEGPVSVSESVEIIRSIGEYLGERELDDGESREYFGRYRIIRAVDSTVFEGLDADIFVVLENARVDHIRNLRLMVSGYLQEAYGYSEEAAAVVAELATIYNAVYRGDLGNFEQRYKSVVLDNLSEEAVGISTVYRDWPGGTELVIPLRTGRALVDPFELADEGVIRQLRERDDMGIAERRDLVSLMEDVVDLEREEIDEERERIAAELEEIEEREREVLERQERLESLDEEERSRAEEEIEREESEIADRTDEIVERAEEVAEAEEQVDEMQEQVQEERDSIAEDRDEMLDDDEVEVESDEDEEPEEEDRSEDESEIAAAPSEEDSPSVVVVETGEENDSSRGRLVRVSQESGEVEFRSEIGDISRRRIREFGDGYLVTRYTDSDAGLLQVVDEEELSVSAEASENIFPETSVRIEESSAYVVVEDGEEWRLGRFDEELQLQAQSDVQVNPATFLYTDSEIVILEMEGGGFVVLDSQTLEEL